MTENCAVCNSTLKLLNCSACKQIAYCGVEHQKSDWPNHKLICKKLQQAEKDGFYKEILVEGQGETPKTETQVHVTYKGSLTNGKVFDSSLDKKNPFTFTLGVGEVILGWDEGVKTMKKGEFSKFYLSSRYAYGKSGAGPDIPPNTSLIFEIERL